MKELLSYTAFAIDEYYIQLIIRGRRTGSREDVVKGKGIRECSLREMNFSLKPWRVSVTVVSLVARTVPLVTVYVLQRSHFSLGIDPFVYWYKRHVYFMYFKSI